MKIAKFITDAEREHLKAIHKQLFTLAAEAIEEGDEAKIQSYLVRAAEKGLLQRDAFGINPILSDMETALVVGQEIGISRSSILSVLLNSAVLSGGKTGIGGASPVLYREYFPDRPSQKVLSKEEASGGTGSCPCLTGIARAWPLAVKAWYQQGHQRAALVVHVQEQLGGGEGGKGGQRREGHVEAAGHDDHEFADGEYARHHQRRKYVHNVVRGKELAGAHLDQQAQRDEHQADVEFHAPREFANRFHLRHPLTSCAGAPALRPLWWGPAGRRCVPPA